jgi:D-alanyl-D-alanine carboxypeptidase
MGSRNLTTRPILSSGMTRQRLNARKYVPLAGIVFALWTHFVLAAQLEMPAAGARELDRVANAAVENWTVGLVIAISKDGHAVFSKGYGKANLELDSPMTPESVLRIASMTKQFTAAAVLLLVQDGKLSLDDPISKWLPRFPGANGVTIRELLTHTSGISECTRLPGYMGKEWRIDRTPQEMVTYIAAHSSPLYEFPPGTAWSYSNSGYQLLGAIIEKVSGMPLKQFYQTRLFDPIGLQKTAVDDQGDVVAHRASGYELAGKERRNAQFISMTAPGAAGFLRSTAGDLLKWSAALFGGKVIHLDLVKLMIEPARLKNGQLAMDHIFKPERMGPEVEKYQYGFGLEIGTLDGHKKIGHNGSIPGFVSRMDTFPSDGVTVVVLVNTQRGMGPHQVLPQIVERIALKYLGAGPH